MEYEKTIYCYRCKRETKWKRGRIDIRQLCCQSCGTYEFKNRELQEEEERIKGTQDDGHST